MPMELTILFSERTASFERAVQIKKTIVAGWTGRDQVSLQKHIAELKELGVKPPSATPVYYRVSSERLTRRDRFEVVGGASSGEVEFVLLQAGGRLWVGLGSDHTDREVERYDVAVSKQICEKPIAGTFWLFDDVKAHWDRLVLRSFISEGGQTVLYQECSVTTMLPPSALIENYTGGDRLPEGAIMFCGTSAARGGIRPSKRFDCELEDAVLGRKIALSYWVDVLPLVS